MKVQAASLMLTLLCVLPGRSQTPANVLVVVNRNSALSRNIAEYYARKRSVPKQNLCPVNLPELETITRSQFETGIEKPVANCLRSGKLTEQILYIVIAGGVPLRIAGSGNTGSTGRNNDGAAVDSELTLLYARMKGLKFPLQGGVPNPFYRKEAASFRHPDFPVYLVTRLQAWDFAGARALVDRALLARNRGRFVVDAKGSDDTGGDRWLKDAAIKLPESRTVFNETEQVVSGIKDVIAYASWGSNDRSRRQRRLGFTWLPGAIAMEFVSTNARTFLRPPENWQISTWDAKDNPRWFSGSPQTLITDYLAEGATGASGHIDEPYLGMTARPDAVLPAYYSGRNLAESFYLGIPVLSWQNIVIGDPLCSLGPPAE